MSEKILEEIKSTVENNKVALFMKGTKIFPRCGFSATVVRILDSLGVEYKDVDILADPEIRVELSKYSNWPTTPQLFINGEFIGGCDIAVDLHQKGELQKKLQQTGVEITPAETTS